MRLYAIKVWGPCSTEDEVLARRVGQEDATALVVAPSKSIANQVCYLASTANARGQSNYQEIDCFATPVPCVWSADVTTSVLEPDFIRDLQEDPILPDLTGPDPDTGSGTLYLAECTAPPDDALESHWVFARDGRVAHLALAEHLEISGAADLSRDAVRVDLHPTARVRLFWSVVPTMWELRSEP